MTVGGKKWDLWTGTVQTWRIASFVAVEDIPYYNGDLNDFFSACP